MPINYEFQKRHNLGWREVEEERIYLGWEINL
jgi:hypothetical protein